MCRPSPNAIDELDRSWDNPTMTVIADNKKRVTLPTKPGERFDLQAVGQDQFVLTRLAPVIPRASRVKIQRKEGFTIGKLDHPINEAALQEALAEFP